MQRGNAEEKNVKRNSKWRLKLNERKVLLQDKGIKHEKEERRKIGPESLQ